jgi:hypothetical protein
VLAHLPSPREPVLLEQFGRCADQEPALSFATGGGLGDRFDQAATSGGDQRQRALEPGSCDPLAAMPPVGEEAGDPPARRRRWVLAVLTAVPQVKLVRAAVLAPALGEPVLIENQRRVRVACRLRVARSFHRDWLAPVPGSAGQPMAGRSCHPLTGCSLKALIPLNISSLMMKE